MNTRIDMVFLELFLNTKIAYETILNQSFAAGKRNAMSNRGMITSQPE